jgi:1,4-alpha-glucan branching enzyme
MTQTAVSRGGSTRVGGNLALILHAHLPYVRHPEYEDSLEERWLYEALADTYVPLLLVLEGLVRDRVDFRLTLSLTPPLASMLADSLLKSRFVKRLDGLLELCDKEKVRTRHQPEVNRLARMYQDRFARVREAYEDRYRRDLLGAFGRFQDLGKLEVVASAATHGYLPLLALDPGAVRAQVRVGVQHYEETFHRKPRGFWLPECGYYEGADLLLREHGIAYTVLETHGVTRARPRPRAGVYAPHLTPGGVAVFGRDPECSRQVWSATEGYPGDPNYREFYRDIGFDLDLKYIGPYVHRDGIRVDTGIKYYRITRKGEPKELYVPERAEERAEAHATHFLEHKASQVELLRGLMSGRPVFVAPFDAELFGHWWFEGPLWLDRLIRKAAARSSPIRLVTLSEHLDESSPLPVCSPCPSSWGAGGFHDVWLNRRNDWLYPHLHHATQRLERLAAPGPALLGVRRCALNQAARELLLAQSSDWAFMIHGGNTGAYAARRVREHLANVQSLCAAAEADEPPDAAALRAIEDRHPLFPLISYELFAPPVGR